MATYAIGDLQGSYEPLQRLLDSFQFDPARDRLWFAGDLVNRGPDSLSCLRFVKGLGPAATTVLGNHDLHLLCVAYGHEKGRKRDTLDEILAAPDRDELLLWLRHRPLMHVEGRHVLVHAALLPEWDVALARALAAEVEAKLQGGDFERLLEKMYGDEPARWHEGLAGIDRLRLVINAMTRLRVCEPDGTMALAFKGKPGELPQRWIPWFDVPGRRSRDHTIICGHWSALGLKVRHDLMALDSGCVWGRCLTAIRLEDGQVFQARCPEPRAA